MKYRCTKCLFQFNEPLIVDYGVELWMKSECCPHCDSERIEENDPMDRFKTALQEIAYAGKYYTKEDMIEIAKKALRPDPNVVALESRIELLKNALEILRTEAKDEEVVNLNYFKVWVWRLANDTLKEIEKSPEGN